MLPYILRKLRLIFVCAEPVDFIKKDDKYIGYQIRLWNRWTGWIIDRIDRKFEEPIKTRDYAVVAKIIDFNNWKRGK